MRIHHTHTIYRGREKGKGVRGKRGKQKPSTPECKHKNCSKKRFHSEVGKSLPGLKEARLRWVQAWRLRSAHLQLLLESQHNIEGLSWLHAHGLGVGGVKSINLVQVAVCPENSWGRKIADLEVLALTNELLYFFPEVSCLFPFLKWGSQ